MKDCTNRTESWGFINLGISGEDQSEFIPPRLDFLTTEVPRKQAYCFQAFPLPASGVTNATLHSLHVAVRETIKA